MLMALDLTRRQAGRVLEQAIRHRTAFEFELPARPGTGPHRGRFVGRVDEMIVLRVEGAGFAAEEAIGAYLDARLLLSDDLYLFTTRVVDLPHRPAEGLELLVAVPEAVQVANRRRFDRLELETAARARVWLDPQGPAHEGLLDSVSPNGLSVVLNGLAADEQVRLGLELAPTEDAREQDALRRLRAALATRISDAGGMEGAP